MQWQWLGKPVGLTCYPKPMNQRTTWNDPSDYSCFRAVPVYTFDIVYVLLGNLSLNLMLAFSNEHHLPTPCTLWHTGAPSQTAAGAFQLCLSDIVRLSAWCLNPFHQLQDGPSFIETKHAFMFKVINCHYMFSKNASTCKTKDHVRNHVSQPNIHVSMSHLFLMPKCDILFYPTFRHTSSS